MSKCYQNWQRLPNSRMDRQHRTQQFLRKKDQADAVSRKLNCQKKEMEAESNG